MEGCNSDGVVEEWEVEYSRFFNFPVPTSYSIDLKILPRCKTRSGGTWLPSSSTSAVLRISKSRQNHSNTVLSVIVDDITYEEHFISNLNISWLQSSCTLDCPDNAFRVVFLSFSGCSGQNEKFAVKFPSYFGVQSFLKIAEERMRDSLAVEASDLTWENTSTHEVSNPNMLQKRLDVDFDLSIGDFFPTSAFNGERVEFLEQLPANNVESTYSNFLPSFTELLVNCSLKNRIGQPVENEGPHASQVEARTSDSSRFPCADFLEVPLSAVSNKTCKEGSSPNVSITELADALERPVPDIAMDPQIVKYMSDASFTDMLARIENAITDLGGSLGL